MLVWVDFAYFARQVSNMKLAENLLRLAWFATPMFFTFISLFVVYFINKPEKYIFLNIPVLTLGVATSLVTGFTSLVIEGFKYVNGSFTIIYGPMMYPFLGVVLILIFATLYPLFERYTRASQSDKQKIIYFLIGLVVFYIANFVFNIILPIFMGVVRLYYFGDYSTIFFLVFTAYAILRHRLIDTKVVATELFTFTMWMVMVTDYYLTQDAIGKIVRLGFSIFMIPFGVLLVRSVYKEVDAREKTEQLAKKLKKANVQLEALSKAKSEFVTIASHQLRAPITAIKGYSSMLVEGDYGKYNKKAKEPLNRIYQSASRLVLLIDEFLNLSKIERKEIEYNYERTNLAEVVESIFNEFNAINKSNKKNVRLDLKIVPDIDYVSNVDTNKIRQVYGNLIDNAMKYTDKGFVKIRLEKSENESDVLFSVSDSGMGMSRETINRIFEKFTRAGDNAFRKHTEGLGLGLYVCRKIVEAHNGKIWAESKGEGKGSTFLIELPSTFVPPPKEEASKQIHMPHLSSGSILLGN